MTGQQVQIKLKNLEKFHIGDDTEGKVVEFKGSGFEGNQLDAAGTFVYSEKECEGIFNIYNTHYKDHVYNSDQHSAMLTLEKNDNEENIGISIHGCDANRNIEIETLSLL